MREVNNNPERRKKIQKHPEVFSAKASEVKAQEELNEVAPKDLVTTFDNPQAEALGRSQVSGVDSIQSDVDMILKNPKIMDKADKFFSIALKTLEEDGHPDPYAKAAELTGAFVEELVEK